MEQGRDRAANGTVTLADVAERVGVSARTVSRVVNDEGGCTEETRQRILDAIDELGYRPNLMARALIRRRSDTVGLITAEMLDPFFPEFADGVQQAIEESGRTMFLASTGLDPVRQRTALTSLVGHGVDGAIVFPAIGGDADLLRFAREGLPIVVINSEIEGPSVSAAVAEIEAGARMGVDHLLGLGRRRVALLIAASARRPQLPSRRERGWRTAHEVAGVTIDEATVIGVENSIGGGRTGMAAALEAGVPPDAVFAYNDQIAIGALQECLRRGVRVPDDIAIVGFDDIQMCEALTPSLTTVRIDRDRLGRMAVEMLRDLVDTGQSETRRLPVELVRRESA